jgi:hypothetical protein
MKQLHGNTSRFVRELTPEDRAFISKRVKSTDRNIRACRSLIADCSMSFDRNPKYQIRISPFGAAGTWAEPMTKQIQMTET